MIDYPPHTYNRDIFHGGDLSWAKKVFGADGPDWIDMSTGINPFSYPVPALPDYLWTNLPDGTLEKDMLDAARQYYEISASQDIVACPGTQSALQLLPRIVDKSSVAILSPTYAEHAKCWSACGHLVHEVKNLKEISSSDQIVVVVTPNNPTGFITDLDKLEILRKRLNDTGGVLVLDEAFMDMTPQKSFTKTLPSPGVIILKSFGKFFGLAGLRLGFALGDTNILSRLRQEFGPWAVSGPAAYIGKLALADTDWTSATRQEIKQQSQKLTSLLSQADLPVIGGTGLFSLIETDQSSFLFEILCTHRILTRPFPSHPNFLRFGLPGKPEHWLRFEQALLDFRNRSSGIK